MNVLCFDVGSSSIKAAIVRQGRVVGTPARAAFGTHYDGDRAEVNAESILHALGRVFAQLGSAAKKVDVIAMTLMGPSWLAMDRHGTAITPVVTHQDRRSIVEARGLLKLIGKSKILKVTGNLPFPGSISSTTWSWFNRHEPRLMKRADLVGHLQTYLHRQLNGSRVIDPSNGSFLGLFNTLTLNGWNEGLCDAVGATEHQLPQMIDSDGVAGMVTRSAGERFGLTHGTPMLVGCIDTSASMMLSGCKSGQIVNGRGSTDVLAVCTDRPRANEKLLTRALGVGRKWMTISTLAAAGSALSWAKDQLFADLPVDRFFKLVAEIAKQKNPDTGGVMFDPHLAGDRTSIEQRRATLRGLTLASTRRQMLAAVIEALARASAERLSLFQQNGIKFNRQVMLTGGVRGELDHLLQRDWPGRWKFKYEENAALRGLSALAEGAIG